MLKFITPAIVMDVLNQNTYNVAIQYKMPKALSDAGWDRIRGEFSDMMDHISDNWYPLGVPDTNEYRLAKDNHGNVFLFVEFQEFNLYSNEVANWLKVFNNINNLENVDGWLNNNVNL